MEQNFTIDPNIAYDVVELPSRGIYYPNKRTSIRVAYLTAADENILTSQNLINQGRVISELLKRKIVDKDISSEDLVEEDRQAVLIFLRNTAFGTEYKLKINDPKTNEPFEVEIDLSTLKLKEFNLKANENGHYDYFMKRANKQITFMFLNKKQEDDLENIQNNWEKDQIAPVATKRLEMLIKSVDGNPDIMAIYQFIQKLPILDSQEFKQYVLDNKPGLDLNQEVTTPSKEKIQIKVGFGLDFFRPFYGIQKKSA